MITTEFSRPEELLVKMEARLNQVKLFITAKKEKLKANMNRIEKFMKAAGGTDLTIGNCYSTHHGDDEYVDGIASLICNCTMRVKDEVKNKNLKVANLDRQWEKFVNEDDGETVLKNNIAASFHDYQIKGNVVNFKIWVK